MLGFMQIGGKGANLSRPVLDQLSAAPTIAYGLRQLSSSYAGKAINVRRSSDNTAIDIGFVNGALDTATLLSFTGSGNGFVTTWYNQGSLGSSANMAQTVAASQPQIVASGVLETFNNLPAVLFSGAQDLGTSSIAATGTSGAYSVNAVASPNAGGSNIIAQDNGGAGSRVFRWGFNGSGKCLGGFWNTAGSAVSPASTLSTPQNIITAIATAALVSIFTNGRTDATVTVTGTLNQPAGAVYLGYDGGSSSYFSGPVLETMVFASALSTDRATLEHNQQQFYRIAGK